MILVAMGQQKLQSSYMLNFSVIYCTSYKRLSTDSCTTFLLLCTLCVKLFSILCDMYSWEPKIHSTVGDKLVNLFFTW